MSRAPAHYFPVEDTPFEMRAGLSRLGRDFGNGERDALVFQIDEDFEFYRNEKQRIFATHPERHQVSQRKGAQALISAVLDEMRQRLQKEQGSVVPTTSNTTDGRDIALSVQEDFAVVQVAPDGSDQLVLLSVCFPSGWQPETLLGESFERIHAPVPGFEALMNKRSQLLRAMVERGPYVRFVWSLTADPRLDHHPIDAPRAPWTEASEAFLRVERQVTIPFPQYAGSLFLIRTYVYPASTLTEKEAHVLLGAVEMMPARIKEYKGITPKALDVLRATCPPLRPGAASSQK